MEWKVSHPRKPLHVRQSGTIGNAVCGLGCLCSVSPPLPAHLKPLCSFHSGVRGQPSIPRSPTCIQAHASTVKPTLSALSATSDGEGHTLLPQILLSFGSRDSYCPVYPLRCPCGFLISHANVTGNPAGKVTCGQKPEGVGVLAMGKESLRPSTSQCRDLKVGGLVVCLGSNEEAPVAGAKG